MKLPEVFAHKCGAYLFPRTQNGFKCQFPDGIAKNFGVFDGRQGLDFRGYFAVNFINNRQRFRLGQRFRETLAERPRQGLCKLEKQLQFLAVDFGRLLFGSGSQRCFCFNGSRAVWTALGFRFFLSFVFSF